MKNTFGFTCYLAGLSMLGYLAMDMYLPAFGTLRSELGLSAGAVGASLSIFLAGFAIGQLLWGPLSDRLGRKPVLLAGLSLFALGCAGMFWVQDSVLLLSLRFIQAIGICAAAVTWQALVIDRYPPDQANRVFAGIMPLMGLSPALAPLLGAVVLSHLGWQAIFAVLLGLAVLLIVPTLLLKEKPRVAPKAVKTGVSYWHLLCTAKFSGNVMIFAACSASFFAWLTASPFILGDMGYSPSDIGLSYALPTVAFMVGGYSCRSALQRISGRALLPWLLVAYCASMVGLYGVATQTVPTLTTLLIPFCLMALVNGASYPIVVASALMPFSENSGKAAGLQNTLQLGLCFLGSLLVSTFISQPLQITVEVMLATAPLAVLGYFIQRRKVKAQALVAS
ncbi:Bcr/CflA family multidrug efflux MFS transporter [Pseudomonas sp. FSL R10-0056]|uniref:Bcr/CflA family efflux transporter n=1 Tax=Pseudomonas fragi TaxID=296 RepID=A0A267CG85_PSEFR|nr:MULTISPECIES: purine nucleoside transporter PunC [Pseudomonas]MBP3860337.1 Bcr/CflA family multidrug efflux MFS transporter [Pseudomonas sp.]MDN5405698.1 Bcr/CflA family multidrug efflux MFS transporter [Pseudomonas sp.]MDN5451829.1 Bcr/CflA family multidrug efflux MFS transporter [Pseudomonas sp.]MDN5457866.1 Bcr/CflA family multidrug efflux MFS transporter [Pseudomonas sp.]MQT63401.1 Bcr/CflA family multidrug efflux MFS transporter [Pseudomonas sp. FSL R10-0056]